jgi:glycosyltransferase involved in cell wall biosynthesis
MVIIYACFKRMFLNPVRFFSTLLFSYKIGVNSDRGIVRHFIYFMEACLLVKLTKTDRIDHIHAHFGTNSTTVVMLARLLGGPGYSFTVHGPEEFDKPEFIALREKINNAKFVVAISSFGKSQLYRWVNHSQWKKIHVVHCGLEKSFYDINVTPAQQKKKLVCIGRLCEQKGQLLLIEAAAKLIKDGNFFDLILVGDGPMRDDIEALITYYEIESYVNITGWVSGERIQQELLDATAMILPSFAEGLPVVIMEAMALERPVLSTYIAGIPELVIPGVNGWLVPAGSLESLVSGIKDVIHSSNDDIQRLGQNARKRVIERHNIDTEATKLSSLFSMDS